MRPLQAILCAVPGQDEAPEGALLEDRRLRVDVVEVPLLGLPAGLPLDVRHGLLHLVVRSGRHDDNIVIPDGLNQIGPVLFGLHAPGEWPEHSRVRLVSYQGVV